MCSTPNIHDVAKAAYEKGVPYDVFAARIITLVQDKSDKYGIGSMSSQWTSQDVADDIVSELAKEFLQIASGSSLQGSQTELALTDRPAQRS